MVFKAWLQGKRSAAARSEGRATHMVGAPLHVKVVPTILIGAAGGLLVGLTSVGSGSLIIICLMLLYPDLRGAELVGHGPGAGGPARHVGRDSPHHRAGLRARADRLDPDRRDTGRVRGRARLVDRARRGDPATPRARAARLGAQAARRADPDGRLDPARDHRRGLPAVGSGRRVGLPGGPVGDRSGSTGGAASGGRRGGRPCSWGSRSRCSTSRSTRPQLVAATVPEVAGGAPTPDDVPEGG